MLLKASAYLEIALERSLLVGDKLLDLQAGASAGCSTILVRTEYGAALEPIVEKLRLIGDADSLLHADDVWQAAT